MDKGIYVELGKVRKIKNYIQTFIHIHRQTDKTHRQLISYDHKHAYAHSGCMVNLCLISKYPEYNTKERGQFLKPLNINLLPILQIPIIHTHPRGRNSPGARTRCGRGSRKQACTLSRPRAAAIHSLGARLSWPPRRKGNTTGGRGGTPTPGPPAPLASAYLCWLRRSCKASHLLVKQF